MLKKMAHFIVQRGRIIEKFFIAMTILCAVCYPFVGVNYDLSKYLPDFAPTKQALDVMEQEFGYPGMARIMVKDVTLPEARTIRQRISRVDGVDLVVGPDLAANVYSTDAFIKNSLTDRFLKAPLGDVEGHSIGEIKSIKVEKIEKMEPPITHMIPE